MVNIPKSAKTFAAVLVLLLFHSACKPSTPSSPPVSIIEKVKALPDDHVGSEIKYGYELFTRTAYYLGPKGSVKRLLRNRTSCQNCHLEGGTRLFSNHLLNTHAIYPQYRAREGKVLTLAERINTCVERPMNGRPLDHSSREMKALLLYFKWIGTGTVVAAHRASDYPDHTLPVVLPDVPLSIERGAEVFAEHCARCHQPNGQGLLRADEIMYEYPPLWGSESYHTGSSMHQNTILARFIKGTMPYGISTEHPELTDLEALDVAAFINSHPRPSANFDQAKDYPNKQEKSFDFPYGPYADSFSEEQHRLGPFKPIQEYYLALKNKQ